MYLAYFDESGDSGLANSPTTYFVLSCVLVHETKWLGALDTLISLRKRLKGKYGIGTRPEMKSSDIKKGRGPLFGLGMSQGERMKLFQHLMTFTRLYLVDLTVFAVAIHKADAAQRGREPRETAWDFALQRVERFCKPSERAMIFPDEGHGQFIKKLLRRKRRHSTVPMRYGSGTLRVPLESIVEDPNDRKSHDSYLIQVADWAAFAAHRSRHVHPLPGVHDGLWDALGDRRLMAVNRQAGGPPGIKLYP